MWVEFWESTAQGCVPTLTLGALNRWKPAPVSVSGVPPPAEPLVGEMAVIAICCVKTTPPPTAASPTPATDTTTAPAPSGASPTVQLIESMLAAKTAHATPPKVTLGAQVGPSMECIAQKKQLAPSCPRPPKASSNPAVK